jgi:DNA-binding transcriptional ArsR family regulator
LAKKFLLDIYNFIKEGYNPSQISKRLEISKQVLNYYLSSLKKKNFIEKVGYGVWKAYELKEVKKINLGSLKEVKKVRGHAFVWKIRIPKKIDWKSALEMKGVKYQLVNKNTPRIMINGKKIWLGKENVVIYDLESYLGQNAVETRKYAIYNLLSVLKALESKLGVYLNSDDRYTITISRQHFSLIKNCLAIQCNKEGKKIQVSNDNGMWFIIDNSYNLNEAETISPKDALKDSMGLQRYFNEHKETDFQVTPKFILTTMNGIQKNQLIFAENMKSHIDAIQTLSNKVKELSEVIKELKK